MAGIVFDTEYSETVVYRKCYRYAVSERQLARVLESLTPEENPLKVEAKELTDYLDGKGELLTRVGYASAQGKILKLLDNIAKRLRRFGLRGTVVDSAVEGSKPPRFLICRDAFTE
jgi:hypothetical protein